MFVECVQPEVTARIWDCLLLDGHDVLFRFAFALLSTNRTYLTEVGLIFEAFFSFLFLWAKS